MEILAALLPDANAEDRSDATPREGRASVMDNPVYLGPHLFGDGPLDPLTLVMGDTPVSIVCPVGDDGRPLSTKPFLMPDHATALSRLVRFRDEYRSKKKAVSLSYYLSGGHDFLEQELMVEMLRLGMVQERMDYLTKVPNVVGVGVEEYARLANKMASSSGEDWPAVVAEGDPVLVAGCAPSNKAHVREHILRETGCCINLDGGEYHLRYKLALKHNASLWVNEDCLLTKSFAAVVESVVESTYPTSTASEGRRLEAATDSELLKKQFSRQYVDLQYMCLCTTAFKELMQIWRVKQSLLEAQLAEFQSFMQVGPHEQNSCFHSSLMSRGDPHR